MKRIQTIEIQKKKYLPAFYTLKESHIASTRFQGILLCTQKQKEATKSKELIAKKTFKKVMNQKCNLIIPQVFIYLSVRIFCIGILLYIVVLAFVL